MVEPRFHTERQWFYRELSGKYYNWKPFTVSIILIELPFLIVATTAFFCVFYWTVGFSTDPTTTFYTFLMLMIFIVFTVTLGQAIAAWTPSTQVAALLNPFIFSALNLFCGVMMPKAAMPKFWSSWMYWLDPYHYVIEGLVAAQLHDVSVTCKPDEYYFFRPPTGQSCGQYAATFLEQATGYIADLNATDVCRYCQYQYGQDFYQGLSMSYENRWRNIGIMFIYLFFNVTMITVGIRYLKWNRR